MNGSRLFVLTDDLSVVILKLILVDLLKFRVNRLQTVANYESYLRREAMSFSFWDQKQQTPHQSHFAIRPKCMSRHVNHVAAGSQRQLA